MRGARPAVLFKICLNSILNIFALMGSANNPFDPWPEGVINRLGKILRACAVRIDTISVDVDDVMQTLGELASQRSGLVAPLPPRKAKRRRSDEEGQRVIAYARSVVLKWTSVDSLEAVIDGQRVVLPRTLGLLLELLAARDGAATGLARSGWKTRRELRLRMAEKTGRKVSQHALENQLSRLRKVLHEQAGLGALIRRNGRFLVRFARAEDVAEEEGASPLPL